MGSDEIQKKTYNIRRGDIGQVRHLYYLFSDQFKSDKIMFLNSESYFNQVYT